MWEPIRIDFDEVAKECAQGHCRSLDRLIIQNPSRTDAILTQLESGLRNRLEQYGVIKIVDAFMKNPKLDGVVQNAVGKYCEHYADRPASDFPRLIYSFANLQGMLEPWPELSKIARDTLVPDGLFALAKEIPVIQPHLNSAGHPAIWVNSDQVRLYIPESKRCLDYAGMNIAKKFDFWISKENADTGPSEAGRAIMQIMELVDMAAGHPLSPTAVVRTAEREFSQLGGHLTREHSAFCQGALTPQFRVWMQPGATHQRRLRNSGLAR